MRYGFYKIKERKANFNAVRRDNQMTAAEKHAQIEAWYECETRSP
jgi:hypothetical protein